MNQPWEAAPEAGSFSLQPYVGCLLLIAIGGYHPSVQTRNGVGDAVRAAIVILDGPEAGREFGDVLIFNNRPVRRLRGMAGKVALHRIVVEIAQGGNQAFSLADSTPADNQLAWSWYNAFPGKLDSLLQNVMSAYATEERRLQQPQPQPQQQRQQAQPQSQWQQQPQQQWAQASSPASPTTAPPSTPAWAQPSPPQWQQPSFQSVTTSPAPTANQPVEPPSSPPPWSGNGGQSATATSQQQPGY